MEKLFRNVKVLLLFTLIPLMSVNAQFGNWVPVDTMANTFSTASLNLGPIASATYSPLIMVLHRANTNYATSSGALVYNVSTDNGATWSRKLPPVNSQIGYSGRYPTLTLKLDSGMAPGSAKAFSTFGHMSAIPEVDHGAALVSDVMNGVSTSVAFNQMSGQGSNQICWASDTENLFFWVSQNASNGAMMLNRTSDLVNIQSVPMLPNNAFAGAFIPLQGESYKGKLYFGFLAIPPESAASGMYLPGYVTSTDNGISWSAVNWVDFRQAVGMQRFDRLWDYKPNDLFVNYSADMVVGYDGRVHFALGLQDTNQTTSQNRNAIVELTQQGSYWVGFVVSDNLKDYSYMTLDGPAAGQMGYSVNIAASRFFGIYAVSFVHPGGSNPLDSLCDIYLGQRVEGIGYGVPFNLTGTPGKNENNHHMSPRIYSDLPFFHHYAQIIYNYPKDYTGHFPNGQGYETQPSVIWFNKVDIPIPLSPVEFTAFTAESNRNGVVLRWATATEQNNHIFIVEKKNGNGFYEIGSVKGAGTSTKPESYSFTDNSPLPGAFYRIKQIDFNGSFGYSKEIESPKEFIYDFALDQNYPNPFNPGTVIKFRLPLSGLTTLEVYNSTGERVATVLNQELEAGEHQIKFDAFNLPGGVYFCELRSGGNHQIVKMLLLK